MDVLSIAKTIGWRDLASAQPYIALDTADLHEDSTASWSNGIDEKRDRPVVQSLEEFFGQQKPVRDGEGRSGGQGEGRPR